MKGRLSVLVGVAAAASLLALAGLYGGTARAQVTEDTVLVGAGDIGNCRGTGDEATAALLDNIAGTVFTLGDEAYPDGTDSDFANCYDPTWGRFKARTRPAVGNHEYETAGATGHFNYFGAAAGDPAKGYYSYDLGTWHVIVLNSNCSLVAGGCDVASPQVKWLKDDLAAHQSTCTLAYWHHPRFSSGIHSGDLSVGAFWNDLYQAGADVVLNGHDHDYERFAPQTPGGISDPTQGIREFVVGTGGANFTGFRTIKPNSEARIANTNGVLKLTLHPLSYDWEFVAAPGATVADSGSGNCVLSPPPSGADAVAPAVQPPRQDLTTGSKLGTSSVPTKISWSATDAQSGVAGYELQWSTDDGTFAGVGLPSATSTAKTFQLQPGVTHQFRVRATDGVGNTSDWATGPAFLVDPHQEVDHDAIVYAGSWAHRSVTSAYGGGVTYASAKGSAAQFSFPGRNVAWVSTKGPDKGKTAVSVDGVVAKTIDLYASTTQPRKVVFTKADLDPATSHTITVQALGTKRAASTGTKIDVDAFVVLR